MLREWHEAENQLDEIVEEARRGIPQIITRQGEAVAVVLSCEEYLRLRYPKQDLVAFFRASPLVGEALDLERDHSPARRD